MIPGMKDGEKEPWQSYTPQVILYIPLMIFIFLHTWFGQASYPILTHKIENPLNRKHDCEVMLSLPCPDYGTFNMLLTCCCSQHTLIPLNVSFVPSFCISS